LLTNGSCAREPVTPLLGSLCSSSSALGEAIGPARGREGTAVDDVHDRGHAEVGEGGLEVVLVSCDYRHPRAGAGAVGGADVDVLVRDQRDPEGHLPRATSDRHLGLLAGEAGEGEGPVHAGLALGPLV
jgi:hypothetical protein